MIDFRRYLKPKSSNYFGFREIEPEELKVLLSKNSGYVKLVGGVECCLGDKEEFFVLKGNRMMERVCTSVKDIQDGDKWMIKKLYFLEASDMLEFIVKTGEKTHGEIPFYNNYREIVNKATKKPLTLLVKENANFS